MEISNLNFPQFKQKKKEKKKEEKLGKKIKKSGSYYRALKADLQLVLVADHIVLHFLNRILFLYNVAK
jgi:hypothetical protein